MVKKHRLYLQTGLKFWCDMQIFAQFKDPVWNGKPDLPFFMLVKALSTDSTIQRIRLF